MIFENELSNAPISFRVSPQDELISVPRHSTCNFDRLGYHIEDFLIHRLIVLRNEQ
jgi:hypothetical protein